MSSGPQHTASGPVPRHVRCARWQDLSAGVLNAEERASWSGPPIPDKVRLSLPAQMDSLHFFAVERSVLGFLRCHVRDQRVDCLLFNRWPALIFNQPQTAIETLHVTRTWLIAGGFLARSGLAQFGAITFGWSAKEAGDGVDEHDLWVRVEGYPSRFLRGAPDRPAGVAWRLVGSLYAWYHGTVSCRYLRGMARWMGAST